MSIKKRSYTNRFELRRNAISLLKQQIELGKYHICHDYSYDNSLDHYDVNWKVEDDKLVIKLDLYDTEIIYEKKAHIVFTKKIYSIEQINNVIFKFEEFMKTLVEEYE